jgi:hypothetical protein
MSDKWIILIGFAILASALSVACVGHQGIVAAAPSFSPSMIIQDGVLKAKLVIGTVNPDKTGLEADDISADTINNAVREKYTSPGGEEIELTFESGDIDDLRTVYPGGTNGDDVESKEVTRSWEGEWLTDLGNKKMVGLSTNWDIKPNNTLNSENYGIWFDATGDGDVDDTEDYPVYNDILFVRKIGDLLIIRPALRLGDCTFLEGKSVEIRGSEFYIKEFDPILKTVDMVGKPKSSEGYAYAEIGDGSYWPNECRFEDEDLEISVGERVRLDQTDTYATYSIDSEFDIVKTEVVLLPSVQNMAMEKLEDMRACG